MVQAPKLYSYSGEYLEETKRRLPYVLNSKEAEIVEKNFKHWTNNFVEIIEEDNIDREELEKAQLDL